MIKNFFAVAFLAVLLSSCTKSTNSNCQYTDAGTVAPASEVATLQTYINANHPAAVQHPRGFFYEITDPGTGASATSLCAAVTVKYVGKLTNGTQFDANTTGVTFTLGGLIKGWQNGIPLVKSGGSINLYIPPSLGYGYVDQRNQQGVVTIPAGSYLVFTIQLVAVQ